MAQMPASCKFLTGVFDVVVQHVHIGPLAVLVEKGRRNLVLSGPIKRIACAVNGEEVNAKDHLVVQQILQILKGSAAKCNAE